MNIRKDTRSEFEARQTLIRTVPSWQHAAPVRAARKPRGVIARVLALLGL